ncbi:MAG: hypothetical protein GY854_22790 [Deltaproteobacteria bacterium]|nr:hypothetical protein [Deltaproteobacteria bacterium]
MPSRILLKLVCTFFVLVALSGCVPPHYSVAVATSDNHVVYGQRHPGTQDDYLVDCQAGPGGEPTNCRTIQLKSLD